MEWSVDIEAAVTPVLPADGAALGRLTAALDDEGGTLTVVHDGTLRASLVVNASDNSTAGRVATRIWDRSMRVAGIAGGEVTGVAVSAPEGTERV